MDSFTAIEVLPSLKGWLTGAEVIINVEERVIVKNVIALDRQVRRVGYEKPFEVGVLESKAADQDIAETGIVESIDINGVGETFRIDDGVVGIGTDQRQRFSDDNGFFVGTRTYFDRAAG